MPSLALHRLDEQRRAVGLGDDWTRSLYYEPVVALVDPNGGLRSVLSHERLSARNVLGNTLRRLHIAVPSAAERLSKAEAEANRQVRNSPLPSPSPQAWSSPLPSLFSTGAVR